MSLQLNERIWEIMDAARYAYRWYGKVPRITSANDGKHMDGSLHYKDLALDFRTGHHWKKPWLTLAQVQQIAVLMRQSLGPEYDVVVENDHVHVEHNPKGGERHA